VPSVAELAASASIAVQVTASVDRRIFRPGKNDTAMNCPPP
jgi:hypothetical protein